MARPKKKRLGRPPGSKNKSNGTNGSTPKRMGRPKKITACPAGTVELKNMIWDTLRQIDCGKISVSEVREVFTQTEAMLSALSK